MSRPRRSPRQPEEESQLRIAALESTVRRLEARVREASGGEVRRPPASSPSHSASSSEYELNSPSEGESDVYFSPESSCTSVSESESGSENESLSVRSSSKNRRKKERKDKAPAPPQVRRTKWASKGHAAQFAVNKKVAAKLRKALEVGGIPREARRLIREGENLIGERNKVLAIADEHGWDVALAFGGQTGLELSKEERRRLDAALASKAKAQPHQPFRSRGPVGSRRQWVPSSMQGKPGQQGGPALPPRGALQCFGCGGYGHVQRFCKARQPQQASGPNPPAQN